MITNTRHRCIPFIFLYARFKKSITDVKTRWVHLHNMSQIFSLSFCSSITEVIPLTGKSNKVQGLQQNADIVTLCPCNIQQYIYSCCSAWNTCYQSHISYSFCYSPKYYRINVCQWWRKRSYALSFGNFHSCLYHEVFRMQYQVYKLVYTVGIVHLTAIVAATDVKAIISMKVSMFHSVHRNILSK